jgi:multiple sugar transport system permease protein
MKSGEHMKTTRRRAGRLLCYLILAVGAVLMVMPFAWMLSTSLKTKSALVVYPPQWIPRPVMWENYERAITSFPFFQYLWNNVKISGLVVLGTLVTSSLAGFAFARMRFPGRDALFLVILAVMMIPSQVTMIPVFLLVRDLGMIDQHSSLIIPTLVSPLNIFIMRQYFLTLPRDLDDAAYVDGSLPLRTFAMIFLPLAAPPLAAISVLTFVAVWNSFIWPLILISDKSKHMMSVGLLNFQNQYQTEYHLMMAATLLSLLPVFTVYLFTQRYFVEGIAISGLKG